MALKTFFLPIAQDAKTVSFDAEESKHIAKVLRLQTQDKILLLNGEGFRFQAQLTLVSPKKVEADIAHAEKLEPNRNHRIHLAIAPTKNTDRTEWLVEKATELGVYALHFFHSERTEKTHLRMDRLQRIMQAAIKQSLNPFAPKMEAPRPFLDILQLPFKQKYLAYCEDKPKTALSDAVQKMGDILILIGPEGDFSPKEIAQAMQNNCTLVHLGENRLRTETAALYALCLSI